MSRFVRKIKGKNYPQIQIVILAAGIGARTKSYEPRCLLKFNNKKTIVENQMDILGNIFNKAEISIVGGFGIDKIIRKIGKRARVIENQMYETTNSGESLKLAVNNSLLDNVLFLHGDLVISEELFSAANVNQSFLLVDSSGKFEEKEVGVTVVDKKATVLSYNLPTKWCQIAFLAENELAILRRLFLKSDFNPKFMLTFEIINKIMENGGSFNCFDIGNSFIKEIDSLKDINNENFSR
jgi:CTP:phosphocholine cytidylyltransferase-like protein